MNVTVSKKASQRVLQNTSSRPASTWVLVALLTTIGVGALISGAIMFLAPDGHLMQWSTTQLAGTPFSNYLIPGIVLFTFVGVFPLFSAYGLLKRPRWIWPNAINHSKNMHWTWTASWAAGATMLIWIATETLLLGLISFLQPVIAV
jgi:hypothetical protein